MWWCSIREKGAGRSQFCRRVPEPSFFCVLQKGFHVRPNRHIIWSAKPSDHRLQPARLHYDTGVGCTDAPAPRRFANRNIYIHPWLREPAGGGNGVRGQSDAGAGTLHQAGRRTKLSKRLPDLASVCEGGSCCVRLRLAQVVCSGISSACCASRRLRCFLVGPS